jgi:hypothetical protein
MATTTPSRMGNRLRGLIGRLTPSLALGPGAERFEAHDGLDAAKEVLLELGCPGEA